jgi:hypothetical protein
MPLSDLLTIVVIVATAVWMVFVLVTVILDKMSKRNG